jgi:DNA-binding transcriptional ArsR family regulator
MTWAFAQDVEPNAKLVLLALANRSNHETGICYPGQTLLGEECSMSSRTVRRHLRSLEAKGLVRRRARMLPEGRGRTSDEYRLAFYDQPDNVSVRSGPTGQNRTTKRTKQDDQPDTVVQVTVREPKENRKVVAPHRMPNGWQPSDHVKAAMKEKHPALDLDSQLEAFEDYHAAKGSKFVDWDRAFQTWCRNASKWEKPAKGSTLGSSRFPAGSGGVYL